MEDVINARYYKENLDIRCVLINHLTVNGMVFHIKLNETYDFLPQVQYIQFTVHASIVLSLIKVLLY